MDIQIQDLDHEKCVFRLKNADISIANSLRRIMIAEIPTMTMDLVEFEENSSVLHDEYIAHRLGLIPLRCYKVNDFNYTRECKCEGHCELCSVEFTLDVTGESETPREVTTKDLKSSNDSVIPVDVGNQNNDMEGNITILKLTKNQRIKLTAIAKKGVGKLHSKWSPVATAVFQYIPEIKINKNLMMNLSPSEKQEFSNSCPSKIYKYDTKNDIVDIEESAIENCTFCNECVFKAKQLAQPDLVSIRKKRNKKGHEFLFTVESTGVLKPEQIVEEAFNVLIQKLKTMDSSIKSLNQNMY